MIDVVNKHTIRDFKYAAVHVDSLSAGFGHGRTNRVEDFALSDGGPCVVGVVIIIIGVDDGKLALGEGYSAEGVAVAEAAVEKNRKN